MGDYEVLTLVDMELPLEYHPYYSVILTYNRYPV